VSGYSALRTNDRAGDELQIPHRLSQSERWSVDDFYRGLVPTWLTASVHKIFKTPAREKDYGITVTLKKSTRAVVRAAGQIEDDEAWALPYYGDDGSDQYCSCGATRDQHLDGKCSTAESALDADQSPLSSLMGTSTLNFMERLNL
ncbi:hypothetical protein BGZ79_005145, partial [Entomortierella chlamydospora]